MKKNKISKNWINKQRRDIYVRQSKVDGYRARSAYKLMEIDEKFHEFLLPLEKNERSPSIFTYYKEVLTTIKLGCYINGMVFPWMKILKTKRINEFTSCICFYSQYDRVSIYLH